MVCALSRARELPDWLDRSIEAHHADLPLAILARLSMPARRYAVEPDKRAAVPRDASPLYEPMLTDNFA